jgi:AraC-like DNA-binding protein
VLYIAQQLGYGSVSHFNKVSEKRRHVPRRLPGEKFALKGFK